jgi:hypothetical protein
MSTAIDDDLDDKAPLPPTRRDGRIIAVPNSPIPAEVNESFLADLVFERALGAARDLVSSQTRPSALSAGGLQAVLRSHAPRRSRAAVLSTPAPFLSPTRKATELNAFRNSNFTLATFPLGAAHAPPP